VAKQEVRGRTEFMPFAPVVLEEHAQEYFPDWDESHIARGL